MSHILVTIGAILTTLAGVAVGLMGGWRGSPRTSFAAAGLLLAGWVSYAFSF